MKSIKPALLGLVLATCAAFASATEIDGFFFVPANMNNAGTLQTYAFNSDLGNGTTPAAGDTFVFDYLFNTTPPPPAAWFGFNVASDTATGIDFSYAGLWATGAPYTLVPNYALTMSNTAVSGFGYVDCCTYDLHLKGTFLEAGASFSGTAASDVPEPMSLSLLGLGLAGMAGLRRRKAA